MLNRIVLCMLVGGFSAAKITAQDEIKKLDNGTVKQLEDSEEFYAKMKIHFDFEDAGQFKVINDFYAKKGVAFQASNKDNSVSTQLYRFIGGRGGIQCIANAKPTYAGKMKINFDVGPNKGKGVSKVGFLLAHVSRNGTHVEAYGARDKKLGVATILKADKGTAFIGLESKVPILYLIIVPNPEIDEDFAVDDLGFEPWKKSMK